MRHRLIKSYEMKSNNTVLEIMFGTQNDSDVWGLLRIVGDILARFVRLTSSRYDCVWEHTTLLVLGHQIKATLHCSVSLKAEDTQWWFYSVVEHPERHRSIQIENTNTNG